VLETDLARENWKLSWQPLFCQPNLSCLISQERIESLIPSFFKSNYQVYLISQERIESITSLFVPLFLNLSWSRKRELKEIFHMSDMSGINITDLARENWKQKYIRKSYKLNESPWSRKRELKARRSEADVEDMQLISQERIESGPIERKNGWIFWVSDLARENWKEENTPSTPSVSVYLISQERIESFNNYIWWRYWCELISQERIERFLSLPA